MNKLIRANFGVILLISASLGLVIPDPGKYAAFAILFLLFLIIFSSFFQFDLSWKANRSELLKAAVFVSLRYILLPILIFFMLNPFSTFFAFAFFFLALFPAGTSSPVIGQMLGGNYNLTILILVLSNFLITLTIPLLTPLFSKSILSIDAWGLFRTLLFTIVLPFFVHLPFRRSAIFVNLSKNYLTSLVVVCLGIIFYIIVARNKSVLLSHLEIAIPYLLGSVIFLILLYLAGALIFYRFSRPVIISGLIASGLNNIGLAVSLSTLYLNSSVTVLFIYGEFAWVIALILVKRIVPIVFRKL